MTGTLYLLHFTPAYHHAGHYLGFTEDLDARIAAHLAGRGSPPLVAAAVQAGCEITVARTWPGDRSLERRMHRQKNTPRRLCPICRAQQPTASHD